MSRNYKFHNPEGVDFLYLNSSRKYGLSLTVGHSTTYTLKYQYHPETIVGLTDYTVKYKYPIFIGKILDLFKW